MKKDKSIVNPIYTDREYELINNPRRMVFLSDIVMCALLLAVMFVMFWVAVYAMSGATMAMDWMFGRIWG